MPGVRAPTRFDDALAAAGQFAGVIAIVVGLGWGLWGVADDEHAAALRASGASFRSEHLTLFVYTPHVAPGGTVAMELEARHFTPLAIDAIEVDDGVETAVYPGTGHTWGHRITFAPGGPDELVRKRFDWLAAPYLPAGAARPLAVRVRYTLTRWMGAFYDEETRTETIALPLPIHTPGGARLHRALAALWSVGLLSILCLAAWWIAARVTRRAARTAHPSKTPGSVLLAWLLCVLNLRHLAWAPFALPVGAALGDPSETLRTILGWLWALLPIAAALASHAAASISARPARAHEGARSAEDPSGRPTSGRR